jgi:hypothetical protein
MTCLQVSKNWKMSVDLHVTMLKTINYEGKFGNFHASDSSLQTYVGRTRTKSKSDDFRSILFINSIYLIGRCRNLTYLCLEAPAADPDLHWCCSHSAYMCFFSMLPATLEVVSLRNWLVHGGMGNRPGPYGAHSRQLRRSRSAHADGTLLCNEFANRAALFRRLPHLRILLVSVPLDHAAHPSRGHRYLDSAATEPASRAQPAWLRAWREALGGLSQLEKLSLDDLSLPPAVGLAGLFPSPRPAWARLRALHLRAAGANTLGGGSGCDGGGPGATDEALLAVAAACPALEELRLDGAGPRVTDRGLEGVAEACPALSLLSVHDAPAVRGAGGLARALAGRRLRWLGLSGTAAAEAFLLALAAQVPGDTQPRPSRPASGRQWRVVSVVVDVHDVGGQMAV